MLKSVETAGSVTVHNIYETDDVKMAQRWAEFDQKFSGSTLAIYRGDVLVSTMKNDKWEENAGGNRG